MIVADAELPGGERTKLLDFGIAKLSDAKDFVKTRTNTMMGTPVYMSPEQCRGAGKVDDRADVYSFGVLLFAMVAGQPPFTGEGLGDIMGKHMYEPPPPLEAFVDGVPAPLAELVATLLAKDKQQRPPMREVVTALEAMAKKLPDLPRKKRIARAGADSQPEVVSRSLGTLAGQSQTAEFAHKPGGSLRRPVLALAVVAALGGAAVVTLPRLTAHPPPPGPSIGTAAPVPAVAPTSTPPPVVSPPPPRAVHWKISSAPAGATVLRESDGKPLCQTPCVHEQPSGPGLIALRLRQDGFQDRVVQLAADSDTERSETLEPLRRGLKLVKKPIKPALTTAARAEPAVRPAPAPAPPPTPTPHARPKIED